MSNMSRRLGIFLAGIVIVILVLIVVNILFVNHTTYSTIYCQGGITTTEYGYKNGDYIVIDSKYTSYLNITPYSEYIWSNENIEIQDFLTMIGIPYDRVKTIYESCVDNECEGKYIISVGERNIQLYISSTEENLDIDTKKINIHLILTNTETAKKIDIKLIGYCNRK